MTLFGETWILLTLLAAATSTISHISDRYLVKNELKNTDTVVVLWGYFAGFMFATPAILTGAVIVSTSLIIISFVSGLLYLTATHYYFRAVDTGEVSRIVPILSLDPVIVLILATLFLGERHHLLQYVGIGLISIGVLIHAIDGQKHQMINKKALLWAILAATFYALKNILASYMSLTGAHPLNILFWVGIALLVFNIPVTIRYWKRIRPKNLSDLPTICVDAALGGASTLLYTSAIVTGPAALVSFLNRIHLLFIFIISEIMDFFWPTLLHERFIKAAVWQKLIGVLFVLGGSFLLI